MSGSPLRQPTLPYHRSHSTPDLFASPVSPPLTSSFSSLSSLSPTPSSVAVGSRAASLDYAPSTKSLPSLPAFDAFALDEPRFLDLKSPTVTVSSAQTRSLPTRPDPAADRPSGRRRSLVRPHSWVPSPRRSIEPDGAAEHGAPLRSQTPPVYADYARNTRLSKSLSLPSGDDAETDGGQAHITSLWAGSTGRRTWKPQGLVGTFGASRSTDSLSSTSRALSRASVYLTKLKLGSNNVFGRGELGAPSAPAILESVSVNGTARAAADSTDASSVEDSVAASGPLKTSATSSDRNRGGSGASSRTEPTVSAGDPLRGPFRDLDSAYLTFTSRPTTGHRMVVVKTTLVPFLRRYANHPSNSDADVLSPEDVQRRATVLGRWWAALLQILDGNSGRIAWGECVMSMFPPTCTPQLLAGVDRPALLQAVSQIMMRPEWRLSTTYFRPLAERSPNEKVRVRSDSAGSCSLGNSDSAFSARSAEHNVRTMFVSNLLAQMALVVDKMSLRHAPLPLVDFAGKTCAYAFFFAPGVADILVRLWGLGRKLSVIKRTVEELGLPWMSRGESEDIVALFPPSMGSLGWTSIRAVREKLRRPAKMPVQAQQIPWHGPWVSRWRGDDTDLLFVFCKHFYAISEQFVPPGLPLVERARAPAFVLVHAQLLVILDNTINRQAAFDAMVRPPLPDAMQGADAALASMAPLLPHSNLLRGMDENRLIVLLRGFLALDDFLVGRRRAFAEAFMVLLKAATKHTRRYDYNCHYLLCEFLQEALFAYSGSCFNTPFGEAARCGSPAQGKLVDLVDWPFWLDVCKMMLASNNTMSEIRVISFIFSVWDIIAADPARKLKVCLGWLLTEEIFNKCFNNWCPMVRAYFMRLLCWRICRDRGSPNEVDAQIFLVVSERLKTVWSHYLWLKHKADQSGSLPPSTAPSLPQPGKRFVIVRTEVVSSQRDDISPTSATDAGSAKKGEDSKTTLASRRLSLLGKVLNLTTAGAQDPVGGSPTSGGIGRRSSVEESDHAQGELGTMQPRNMARGAQQPSEGPAPVPPPKQVSLASPVSDSDSTGSSLLYDTSQFVFRFTLHDILWQGGLAGGILPAAMDRVLTRPRLPAPAQARVSARMASIGRRSESPPPPAPGLPPPTRLVSGWAQGGLVSEAKNAQPLGLGSKHESQSRSRRHSTGVRRDDAMSDMRRGFTPIGMLPFEASQGTMADPGNDGDAAAARKKREPQEVMPDPPAGITETASPYAGRALAEWSLVVGECNSFVDRRRDEGVLGLGDVEVPVLGVEGLRTASPCSLTRIGCPLCPWML